jgi:hypothetical protein
MTDIITVMCLVHHDVPDHAFPVRISKMLLVGDLKKSIKAEKENDFRYIDADKLELWQVNIPANDVTILNQLDLNDDNNNVKKLQPSDDIAELFAEQPIKKHIHIIVENPPSKYYSFIHSIYLSIGLHMYLDTLISIWKKAGPG